MYFKTRACEVLLKIHGETPGRNSLRKEFFPEPLFRNFLLIGFSNLLSSSQPPHTTLPPDIIRC
jgi:hypothetical protein